MKFSATDSALDALGVKHNTNKSSDWTRPSDNKRIAKSESLLTLYEFYLKHLKDKPNLKVLELGAGPDDNIGASVRVWKDYFPKDAEIHVADIKPSAKGLETEGFHTYIGDLGSETFLDTLAKTTWDFVIDDASHIWIHQIMAFRALFPKLVSGGVFIMEDLCTSYDTMRKSYSLGFDMKDAVDYFLALSRGTCAPFSAGTDAGISEIYKLTAADHALIQDIRMITWVHNSCIIIKR
jgi:hypothetical protein